MIDWTPEKIATLKSMWFNPEFSAKDIALKIGEGATRNAVIGKAKRLGLSTPVTARVVSPDGKKRKEQRQRARAKTKTKASPKPRKNNSIGTNFNPWRKNQRKDDRGNGDKIFGGRLAKATLDKRTTEASDELGTYTQGCSLVELGHDQCRGILSGEGEHTVFCGRPVATSRFSYCQYHLDIYTETNWQRHRKG